MPMKNPSALALDAAAALAARDAARDDFDAAAAAYDAADAALALFLRTSHAAAKAKVAS